MPQRLLVPGNSKLGKDLWIFNIPPMQTCPGATPACLSACYAMKGMHWFESVRKSHRDRLEAYEADPAGFPARILGEIAEVRATVVRIHSAGDFYSPTYVEAWSEIIRGAPQATFLAYTRSWRDPELLPCVAELAKEPNMRLWYSADRDTGRPPKTPGVRVAYMASDVSERVPPWSDLVFIDHHPEVPTRRINGIEVCPVEDGVVRNRQPTCTGCRKCFSGYKFRRIVGRGAIVNV